MANNYVRCPNCKLLSAIGWNHCPHCGASLRSAFPVTDYLSAFFGMFGITMAQAIGCLLFVMLLVGGFWLTVAFFVAVAGH